MEEPNMAPLFKYIFAIMPPMYATPAERAPLRDDGDVVVATDPIVASDGPCIRDGPAQ